MMAPTLVSNQFNLQPNLIVMDKNLAFQLENIDADLKRMNNALMTGQDLRTVPLSHPIQLSPLQMPTSPSAGSGPFLAYVDPLAPLRDMKAHLELGQGRVTHLMELARKTPIHLMKPHQVAHQLSILEQELFVQIKTADFIQHKPPTSPIPTVSASTDFFNFVSRIVESSILAEPTVTMRARVIYVWTKVANHLFQLRNMQTLKAITSAMSTPPIARLKRTWSIVPAKSLRSIQLHQQFLSEQRNYAHYRDWLSKNALRPTVPYVGLYIHDVYYVLAAVKKDAEASGASTPTLDWIMRDKRMIEISNQLHFFQTGPRYPRVSSGKHDIGIPTNMNAQTHRESTGLTGLIRGLWASGPTRKPSAGSMIMSVEDQLRELDDETYTNFAQYWILTRERVSEKEVDDLSMQREPKSLDEVDEMSPEEVDESGKRVRRGVVPSHSGDFTYLASQTSTRPPSVIESVATESTNGHERKRSGLLAFLGASTTSLEPALSTSASMSSLHSSSNTSPNLHNRSASVNTLDTFDIPIQPSFAGKILPPGAFDLTTGTIVDAENVENK
jgi:hypothetical protein